MAMQETGAKRTKTASSLLLKNSSSVQSFKEKQKLTVTLSAQLLCRSKFRTAEILTTTAAVALLAPLHRVNSSELLSVCELLKSVVRSDVRSPLKL